tara:strand:+ start:508 stop:960 length:453 start_codon:yes stop_codon:yes gene_type:complete
MLDLYKKEGDYWELTTTQNWLEANVLDLSRAPHTVCELIKVALGAHDTSWYVNEEEFKEQDPRLKNVMWKSERNFIFKYKNHAMNMPLVFSKNRAKNSDQHIWFRSLSSYFSCLENENTPDYEIVVLYVQYAQQKTHCPTYFVREQDPSY